MKNKQYRSAASQFNRAGDHKDAVHRAYVLGMQLADSYAKQGKDDQALKIYEEQVVVNKSAQSEILPWQDVVAISTYESWPVSAPTAP